MSLLISPALEISDDELPNLRELLLRERPLRQPATASTSLRRSPRKEIKPVADLAALSDVGIQGTSSAQVERSPGKKPSNPARQSRKRAMEATVNQQTLAQHHPKALAPSTGNGRTLNSRATGRDTKVATASRRSTDSKSKRWTDIKSKESTDSQRSNQRSKNSDITQPSIKSGSMMSLMTEAGRHSSSQRQPLRSEAMAKYTRRFVMKEAHCDDDEESGVDGEDDEDTDLSGFIVDDDALLSVHEASDDDSDTSKRKETTGRIPRRRLQRGRRKIVDDSEEEEILDNELSSKLKTLRVAIDRSERGSFVTGEVIDLTSPAKDNALFTKPERSNSVHTARQNTAATTSFLDRFEHVLRISPPKESVPPQTSPSKGPRSRCPSPTPENDGLQPSTPPRTPPRSPSKLKSPSKLLSPSKRKEVIPRSPHRQSTDAFWDLGAVNSWNDHFSPKKTITASPRKNRIAQFQLWSDDDSDIADPTSGNSSDSLPSPCSSPTKPASPNKKMIDSWKAERKLARARKDEFNSIKHHLAAELFNYLDIHVTHSRLAFFANTTGGVKILWSKTLRKTAGRANWRRVITKPSSSPIKMTFNGEPDLYAPNIKTEHFASIELAEKVIDSHDRLVNTLTHEFCHLAMFMVSNIRDNPHGAEFQNWAKKATQCLSDSDNETWKKVKVTTKHTYEIEYSHLWVCSGRRGLAPILGSDTSGPGDGGCGLEYGRHSKSIDPETQRCGKCLGRLMQVKPKPRASPKKKIDGLAVMREVEKQEESEEGITWKKTTGVDLADNDVEVFELSD